MFTIIGGDGKEYGPVPANQLREWIAAGRANLDTKAKRAGSEEFIRLGDYVEFGAKPAPPPLMEPSADDEIPAAPAPAATGRFVSATSDAPAGPADALADIGPRTGAAFINGFLYFLAVLPGSVFTGLRLLKDHPELARGVPLRPENINLESIASGVIWIYAGLGVMMAIQCIFLALRGQNIGKLIAGVRVVNALDGSPAGFVRGALLRFVLPVCVIFLLNLLFPLGLLFLITDYCFMFRADRRCLHDLLAGTKVVKA